MTENQNQPPRLRQGTLIIGLAAFAGGWTVMLLQLLGGRLMAPAFGQTIHQWGALIGTTLTFMTLGYWLGGRLGSGRHAERLLPGLLAIGAFWAALTPWLGRALSAQAEALLGPIAGALAASAILLGPPSLALAAVSPLCVARLARQGAVAASSGAVSALGAMGSIGGTFFGAFLAVPLLGLTGGYASAAVLAAAAAVATGIRPRHAVLLLLPVLPAAAAQRDFNAGFVEVMETPYNTILVADTPEALLLSINTPSVVQSLRRRDGGPTGQYWDSLAAAPALAKGQNVLFLGAAGGSAIEATARAWPGLRALGVEIDPGITDIARRRFGLTVPVVTADARRFVDASTALFDVVVIDLYATGQIPAHVATREFYQAVSRRLAPGGVVALNVYGAGQPDLILAPIVATLSSVFAGLLSAEIDEGNTILFAWNTEVTLSEARSRLSIAPAGVADRLLAALAEPSPYWLSGPILTDNRSDLDLRAARALAARAR